ncbi:hypothetical protein LX69_01955 [Breznakibacter xylanolyticus]|uniref:Lipoprotein n=1 Tax=Breznakibacter xylanolyticus TaxID=990 RepID=A0A2W7N7H9_9BACT|nr:hypothetical protein [Breznakibacter xylanolyticus]PZX16081.1 hypothetical protein LX69_01955 [Breznakibacter xylanolyticus]
MKKLFLFAAVVAVMAIGFQSCKSAQDCPAYSNANTELPAHHA